MARKVIVQYRVKPACVSEHETLIHAVFDELSAKAPTGIAYGAFKRADGVSFVHIAFVSADENPLEAIAAFKAFGARIRERCEVPPEVSELTEVGVFGF